VIVRNNVRGKHVFRSEKILKVMRQMPCAACGSQDGSVAGAHRNEGKGMGLKVSDALVAPLCFTCHRYLDQGKDMTREERREYWNRAFINGIQYAIENELLVTNGKKSHSA
jgi:hypothetical protein